MSETLRRVAIDTRPLRHPAYRRVFIGNSTSFFGSQVTAVAVPVQMYALTHSSLWVGYLGLAGLVPLMVFALWGGALADVLDRRRLFLVASIVNWTVTLALLVQALLGVRAPVLLLVLTGVQSAATAVAGSTASAIVPRIVPLEEVAAANTLNFTAGTLAMVAGPLAAGVVIPFGVGWAYAIDALSFTFALWGALRLPALPASSEGARAGLSDIVFALRYIGGHQVLLLSFVVDIAAMVLALPRALFPAAAVLWFGGSSAIGWLFAAIAIGAAVAGLTSGWIGRVRRQGVALVGSIVVWGLAVAAAGLARQLWLTVLLLAVGGAADLVSAVYRQTILQTYAPDELRGRLSGVFTAVVTGGPRLADLRAGVMAVPLGIGGSWVIGGLACAVVVVLVAVAFPALLRYRTEEAARR